MRKFLESKHGALLLAGLLTLFFVMLLAGLVRGALNFPPITCGILLGIYGSVTLLCWFRWLTYGRESRNAFLAAALALAALTVFLPAAALYGWLPLDIFYCGILAGVCAALAVTCLGKWILDNKKK